MSHPFQNIPAISLDAAGLADLCGVPLNNNLRSVHRGLEAFGVRVELNRPHRLVAYLAQLTTESGHWRYDREIWGPTKAQARYDTRTDLGNSAARDGDGFLYRGRTPIQITGKHNTCEFRDWCREMIDPDAPDFERDPDAMNTDPWEGLGPLWYWTTRRINGLADTGSIRAVTRRINGGYNGLAHRTEAYVDIGLRMLGYSLGDLQIRQFQRDHHDLTVDGVAGKQTIARIHAKLKQMPPCSFVQVRVPFDQDTIDDAVRSKPLNLPATLPAGGVFAAIWSAVQAFLSSFTQKTKG